MTAQLLSPMVSMPYFAPQTLRQFLDRIGSSVQLCTNRTITARFGRRSHATNFMPTSSDISPEATSIQES